MCHNSLFLLELNFSRYCLIVKKGKNYRKGEEETHSSRMWFIMNLMVQFNI